MNISVVMGGFAMVTWVVFFIILGLVVVSASRNHPIRRGGLVVGIALIVAVVLTTVSSGLVFINASERGVVISAVAPKGYRETALEPGLHWIIPFLETVKPYSVAKQTYTMSIAANEGNIQGDDSITARTSDGQEVFVDASVIFMVDPAKVVDLHLTWQDRYSDELVRSVSRGVIRDVVSQFSVAEVYSTERVGLVSQISAQIADKLSANGLILQDFILRNITFSEEFSASIEQKQIAEQQAQQAKFVVEQKRQEAEQARQIAQGQADAAVIAAKGEAEARVISAEAESKSLEMIANVIKSNPNLLTYQYITKLSPTIETMLLPSNSPFLLTLPNGSQVVPTTEP